MWAWPLRAAHSSTPASSFCSRAIVIGLSKVVEPWISALVVGALTMGFGYLLVNRGLTGLRETRLVPTQTIETLKEDARWTTRQGA